MKKFVITLLAVLVVAGCFTVSGCKGNKESQLLKSAKTAYQNAEFAPKLESLMPKSATDEFDFTEVNLPSTHSGHSVKVLSPLSENADGAMDYPELKGAVMLGENLGGIIQEYKRIEEGVRTVKSEALYVFDFLTAEGAWQPYGSSAAEGRYEESADGTRTVYNRSVSGNGAEKKMKTVLYQNGGVDSFVSWADANGGFSQFTSYKSGKFISLRRYGSDIVYMEFNKSGAVLNGIRVDVRVIDDGDFAGSVVCSMDSITGDDTDFYLSSRYYNADGTLLNESITVIQDKKSLRLSNESNIWNDFSDPKLRVYIGLEALDGIESLYYTEKENEYGFSWREYKGLKLTNGTEITNRLESSSVPEHDYGYDVNLTYTFETDESKKEAVMSYGATLTLTGGIIKLTAENFADAIPQGITLNASFGFTDRFAGLTQIFDSFKITSVESIADIVIYGNEEAVLEKLIKFYEAQGF